MSLIAFGESAKLVEQLTTDSGGLGLNPSLVHRIFSLPITHANMVLHEECLESDLTNQNVMLNTIAKCNNCSYKSTNWRGCHFYFCTHLPTIQYFFLSKQGLFKIPVVKLFPYPRHVKIKMEQLYFWHSLPRLNFQQVFSWEIIYFDVVGNGMYLS